MVVYGVQSIILQEIDERTKLPTTGSKLYNIRCAESLDLEPYIEEGEESVARCGNTGAVLGNRRQPDSFVGYDLTLTDNEWNSGVLALVNGFNILPSTAATSEAITTLITPMISGGMNFKPFRLVAFQAQYEGAEIARYTVYVLNYCRGRVSPISMGQDWGQFEYTINAREATVAGLPVMSIGFYTGQTAPSDLTGITITAGVIQPQRATRENAMLQALGADGSTTMAKVKIEEDAKTTNNKK